MTRLEYWTASKQEKKFFIKSGIYHFNKEVVLHRLHDRVNTPF